MSGPPPRTPEQLRNDRRAGIGCSTVLVLAAVGCVIGGLSLLSNEGTLTEAHILSCAPRPPKQPARCRGIWSVDGRTYQGHVDGAGEGDVGDSIEVRADGDKARGTRGKGLTAIAVFGLGALFLVGGVGMVVSMVRPKTPG